MRKSRLSVSVFGGEELGLFYKLLSPYFSFPFQAKDNVGQGSSGSSYGNDVNVENIQTRDLVGTANGLGVGYERKEL